MRKLFLIALSIVFFTACEPDSIVDPTEPSVNFVGTWDRDNIKVYEIESNGSKTLVDEATNAGRYQFNADKTGVLSVSTGDYAINWSHNTSANTILISEVDWVGQVYTITASSETVVSLSGKRNIGGGLQEERIIKLSKQ